MLDSLSLHTKVRRLGYLKLLVEQYFDKDFIPANSFDIFYEKIAGEELVKRQLNDYSRLYRKDNKGIIESLGTGASAQPYTRFAEDLAIIAQSNYSYVLTKHGKIYKVVLERYNKERPKFRFIESQKIASAISLFDAGPETENIFVLNSLDKFFFLKQITDRDYLYFRSILSIIGKEQYLPLSNEKVKYAGVKHLLMDEIRQQLKEYLDSKSLSINDKRAIIEYEKRISERVLQLRSFESIVEPRINWLLDLDLLDGAKHRQDILKLTYSGQKFLEETNGIVNVTDFLEEKYVKTFCLMYQLDIKESNNLDKRIEKYLNFAFVNFKTLAPNRINASQAISYISLMCLLRDGLVVEYKDIKNYIFSIDGRGITIDWFPSENDGSIKKTIE